jgi:hypothetical protein
MKPLYKLFEIGRKIRSIYIRLIKNNMDSNSILITWALGILSTILAGIVLWKLRSQSEKNDGYASAIVALQNTAVNEGHVRTIIKEEMQPMNTALPDLVRSINEVNKFMAEERGYRAGQLAAQRRSADTQ